MEKSIEELKYFYFNMKAKNIKTREGNYCFEGRQREKSAANDKGFAEEVEGGRWKAGSTWRSDQEKQREHDASERSSTRNQE